ncbi:hypothetical protein [Granulicoccus phenolivorans]|uniref:hypothetical protein n=1 Tax=Granulicoccus phenolivorans TaxID=266854 RepID=UPI000418B317|nr:hypothetical protein [Granulicoccus phenolivorans]
MPHLRRPLALLSTVALLGALSACSTSPNNGVAMGDQTLTVAQVQQFTERANAQIESAPPSVRWAIDAVPVVTGQAPSVELWNEAGTAQMLATEYALQAAGLPQPGQDPVQQVDPAIRQVLQERPEAMRLWRANIISATLSSADPEALTQVKQRVPVTLNPRYGSWPEVGSGSLSRVGRDASSE